MGIKEGARLVVPCKALLCAQLVASFFHCNFLQSCCSVFTVGEIIKGFTSRADYGNCSDKWHLLPWVAITALAADTRTAGQSEGSIPDCFEAHRLCFNVSFFLFLRKEQVLLIFLEVKVPRRDLCEDGMTGEGHTCPSAAWSGVLVAVCSGFDVIPDFVPHFPPSAAPQKTSSTSV